MDSNNGGDYKLMLNTFSQQKDENKKTKTKTSTSIEESGFDVLKAIGEGDKNWLKARHKDVTYWRLSKDGTPHKVFDWMKDEVDNARFKAGKRPFFGSQYLWSKGDTFPWGDPKCPDGIGHKEMFNAMVENNDVENQLDCSDYDENLATEHALLEKTNFQGHQS